MNLHDRLRTELRSRSAHIPARAAGAESVIGTAQARLRRTRMMGTAAAVAMVVGVAGGALALRDGDEQVSTDDTVAIAEAAPANTQDEAAAPEQEIAAPVEDAGDDISTDSVDQVVNTEPGVTGLATEDGDDQTNEPTSGTDPEPGDDPDESDFSSDDTVSPAGATLAATNLISHSGGFVAQRSSNQLWFSADGISWSQIASPAPNETVASIASFNGSLYASGNASTSNGTIAWVRSSTDMSSWTDLVVPQPDDDGSSLTTAFHSITGFAAGPGGVILTGETIVDINVEEILDAETFASDSWSLGTNSGDRSKIVVYDTGSGEPVQEIDLADLGIPEPSLDLWLNTRPTPFVALGTTSLVLQDTNLAKGTILRNVTTNGGQYLAAGFSREFSSQILWTSADAKNWEPVPVSVIAKHGADVGGALNQQVIVFSTQGPLFTVQVRKGSDWSEVRLHDQFGGPNDTYRLLDAAFADGGVAAAISSTDAANNTTIHLATSTNGTKWTVADLSSVVDNQSPITTVHSITVNSGSVAVSYETSGGSHHTVLNLG